MMIKNLRKTAAYGFAAAALSASAMATASGPAQADGSVGTQDRGDTYAGCPYGAVCIYPDASWNDGNPEHIYWSYGGHNLTAEYGTHRVFNNQSGSAGVSLCEGYGGSDCGSVMGPWRYDDRNLTPINSIRLSS